MMATKTQILANARYRDKAYDAISICVKKGKREEYRKLAAQRDLSLAMLIQKSIEEYVANHAVINSETAQAIAEANRDIDMIGPFNTVEEVMGALNAPD